MTHPVLGLTGPNAAGKGAVAARLTTAHGYEVRSLSDVIREEAARRGEEPVREVLIRLGNELRAERGPGALAELILPLLRRPAAIDSIRNPAEVEVLRTLPDFVLVRVDAPVELRFERALERRRPGDPQSLDEFRAREDQENSRDPAAQQLDATAALADRTIVNEGSPEKLNRQVDALLRELAGPVEECHEDQRRVDALGLLCPLPVLRIQEAIARSEPGAVVLLIADDPGVLEDLPAWCEGSGNELLAMDREGEAIHCRVRKTG